MRHRVARSVAEAALRVRGQLSVAALSRFHGGEGTSRPRRTSLFFVPGRKCAGPPCPERIEPTDYAPDDTTASQSGGAQGVVPFDGAVRLGVRGAQCWPWTDQAWLTWA